MRSVAIVTDSTCDLPMDLCTRYGITVVPLNVRFGEQVYRDAVELTPRQFFQMLERSSELPKTSQRR